MTRTARALVLSVLAAACQHGALTRPPAPAANPALASPTPLPAEGPDEEAPDDGGELPGAEVDRATKAVVDEAPSRASVPGIPPSPWDRKTTPEYLDTVVEHLGLTTRERALLVQNGFVVSRRHTYDSYGVAMHDIHQQELPLYVSADAVLQGVFRSHEAIMLAAETSLEPRISDVLLKMHLALASAAPAYDAGVAKDADLYLGVARRLLAAAPVESVLATGDEAESLAAMATAAEGISRVTIFGRERLVDWTFYTPRGLYTRGGADLSRYFRAMVWLTRLEMNLVTRGSRSSGPQLDPTETPREATLALVLADLAKRAGVADEIATIDRTYRVLAGPREDVPLADLAKLGANIPLSDPDKAAAALRAAIGDRYPRTINFHVRPWTTPRLPAIATFFGVGITPDAAAVTALSPKGDGRVVRASEVAYLLGHERALGYVGPRFPGAEAAKARTDLAKARRGPDLYAAWLGAIRGLADPEAGSPPSFMKTRAFADARVASAVNGYAAIRHAYVLHAVQVYDEGGCTIPDAWVEPAVAVYDSLLEYARTLEGANDVLPDAAVYAKRLTLLATALRAISVDELAGRPISDAQRAFLRMVAEYEKPNGYVSRSPSRFNGWYPKLFAERRDAFEKVMFIGDFFTSTTHGKISYAGASAPRLGVFIVDVAGKPRAMVGPVASAVELEAPLGKRLDDDAWQTFKDIPTQPWERSYLGDDPTQPSVRIEAHGGLVHAEVPKPLADTIIVETVDDHSATLARGLARFGSTNELVPIAMRPVDGRSGDARGVRLRLSSGAAWTSPRWLDMSFGSGD